MAVASRNATTGAIDTQHWLEHTRDDDGATARLHVDGNKNNMAALIVAFAHENDISYSNINRLLLHVKCDLVFDRVTDFQDELLRQLKRDIAIHRKDDKLSYILLLGVVGVALTRHRYLLPSSLVRRLAAKGVLPKGVAIVTVVSGDGGVELQKGFFIVTIRFAFLNAALGLTRTLSLDTAEFTVLYAEKGESAATIAEITTLLRDDLLLLSTVGCTLADGKTVLTLEMKLVADHKYIEFMSCSGLITNTYCTVIEYSICSADTSLVAATTPVFTARPRSTTRAVRSRARRWRS